MFSSQGFPDIFLLPGMTDMRKGINGLAEVAATVMTDAQVLSGALFLFCSKNRKQLKTIYWDSNGFCMWQKRLEKECFFWPRNAIEVQRLSEAEMEFLLRGLDFTKYKGLPKLQYDGI